MMRKQTMKQIIDRFSLVYTGQILKINISSIRSVLKYMDYGYLIVSIIVGTKYITIINSNKYKLEYL